MTPSVLRLRFRLQWLFSEEKRPRNFALKWTVLSLSYLSYPNTSGQNLRWKVAAEFLLLGLPNKFGGAGWSSPADM